MIKIAQHAFLTKLTDGKNLMDLILLGIILLFLAIFRTDSEIKKKELRKKQFGKLRILWIIIPYLYFLLMFGSMILEFIYNINCVGYVAVIILVSELISFCIKKRYAK